MKKYKLVSAILAIVIALSMCPVIIDYFGKTEWALVLLYPSFAMLPVAVIVLVAGILKNDKNNLPILKGFHIATGVVGIVFGLLCVTVLRQTFFAMLLVMFYSLMLLSLELRELKYQKGFKQKGLALLISIFAVIYSSLFFLEMLFKGVGQKILIIASIFILPILLIVKGVLDIIDAVKPQAVVEEPKVEEPKVEEPQAVEEAKAE